MSDPDGENTREKQPSLSGGYWVLAGSSFFAVSAAMQEWPFLGALDHFYSRVCKHAETYRMPHSSKLTTPSAT